MSTDDLDKKSIEYLDIYANKVLDKVSANVIKYRKEKGLSQAALAHAIGFKSAAYLGKAEIRKDNHHFNIMHIAKIAKVLDKEVSCFFE